MHCTFVFPSIVLYRRSRDQHLTEYPCVVDIYFVHNHPINDSESLKLRKPTKKLEDIFQEYFANDHSPMTALESYKIYLRNKHGDDFEKIMDDGSKFPTYKWCWALYYNFFKRQGVEPTSVKRLKRSESVEDYNKLLYDENGVIVKEEFQEQEEDEPRSKLQNDLNEILHHLDGKILSNQEFQEPVRYFINCFKNFKTDSELISALNKFGK